MTRVSRLKLGLAKSVGAASRLSGRGGGTSLPGKTLLKMQPDAIARMAEGLTRGSVVISATNGKTTTAALLASITKADGIPAVHNRAGANMAGGIATAMLDDTSRGALRGELGIFEVDEAWTADIAKQVTPSVLVLGNLFRDQLDRYGELETLADAWGEMIDSLPPSTRAVVNADDPLLAGIGRSRPGTIFFGLADTSHAEAAPRHAADSKFCRLCGSPLEYDAVQVGHLGVYHCPSGDFTRPALDVAATRIESHGMKGTSVTIEIDGEELAIDLPIPGLYNVYNAVAAVAAASALGLPSSTISEGLSAAKAVFGRMETLEIAGKEVSLLLIKNPTGANEVLKTICAEPSPFDVWIALNDKIADGRDISWVWDADFDLLTGKTGRITCSGTRAEELALRLAYAGVPRESLVIDSRIEQSFDSAIASASQSGTALFALPTYTSLLELRTAIAKRGEAGDYWGDA